MGGGSRCYLGCSKDHEGDHQLPIAVATCVLRCRHDGIDPPGLYGWSRPHLRKARTLVRIRPRLRFYRSISPADITGCSDVPAGAERRPR